MFITFKKTPLLIGGMLISVSAFAQEAVVTSGIEVQGSGGTVSASLGQVVDETQTNASGTVSQGVQQTFEFFTTSISELAKTMNLQLYPNPTSGQVQLTVENGFVEQMQYSITDFNGKLIASDVLLSPTSTLYFDRFPSGIYFLEIQSEQVSLQTFKIIKN